MTRRGHGASTWPESGYEPETLARDLEVVLDSLGLRGPVVLAGHSAGGIEITRIAIDQPQRVAGLIYIDAAFDTRTLMNVFEACTLDASFMEAFNRMMPDLFHQTQIDSAGTPFASPQVVDHMMPALDAALDYSAVKAPALAIYHVPERAEEIFLGTLEQPRECRRAVQRHLYGGIAQFVEEIERGTVVSLRTRSITFISRRPTSSRPSSIDGWSQKTLFGERRRSGDGLHGHPPVIPTRA